MISSGSSGPWRRGTMTARERTASTVPDRRIVSGAAAGVAAAAVAGVSLLMGLALPHATPLVTAASSAATMRAPRHVHIEDAKRRSLDDTHRSMVVFGHRGRVIRSIMWESHALIREGTKKVSIQRLICSGEE